MEDKLVVARGWGQVGKMKGKGKEMSWGLVLKMQNRELGGVQHLDFGGGYTSILPWKTVWTKELGSLQSIASQIVGHN